VTAVNAPIEGMTFNREKLFIIMDPSSKTVVICMAATELISLCVRIISSFSFIWPMKLIGKKF